MTTRVINIKSQQPFDVYIGNRIRFHPQKYLQTKWGNLMPRILRNWEEIK
jgi:hypothetical protein